MNLMSMRLIFFACGSIWSPYILYCIILYYIILYYIILYYIILRYIISYYIILYHIISYYIILYYIILYYIIYIYYYIYIYIYYYIRMYIYIYMKISKTHGPGLVFIVSAKITWRHRRIGCLPFRQFWLQISASGSLRDGPPGSEVPWMVDLHALGYANHFRHPQGFLYINDLQMVARPYLCLLKSPQSS